MNALSDPDDFEREIPRNAEQFQQYLATLPDAILSRLEAICVKAIRDRAPATTFFHLHAIAEHLRNQQPVIASTKVQNMSTHDIDALFDGGCLDATAVAARS